MLAAAPHGQEPGTAPIEMVTKSPMIVVLNAEIVTMGLPVKPNRQGSLPTSAWTGPETISDPPATAPVEAARRRGTSSGA